MLNLDTHHWYQPLGTISMIASKIQLRAEMKAGKGKHTLKLSHQKEISETFTNDQ